MKSWRMVAGVLAFVLLGFGVAPAWACACGGYMSDSESEARARGENALVRFDGKTEEIVLSMAIEGSSKKAAWIMPVPAAAEVSLGDQYTFSRLISLTRPRVVVKKTYWPFRDLGIMGSGRGDSAGNPQAPGGGVEVREQMLLGPFQVVRLGGTSSVAVTDWLRTNGYVVPGGLGANLQPYLTEKWEIVAVKLAPKEKTGSLSGATPPLRLSFASSEIVYPMRLSKGASTEQAVTVYVAAPYRVDASRLPDPSVKPELLFAGRIEMVDTDSDMDEVAEPASYLTAFAVTYAEPSRITDDFHFTRAATDEEFERITYVTKNEPFWSTMGVLIVGLLIVGGGAALIARRLR